MFAVKLRTQCHCCPNVIDCNDKDKHPHIFVTKQGWIRHLCDDCSEIYDLLEEFDCEFWGFNCAEDYIRHVRKEQIRLEKTEVDDK